MFTTASQASKTVLQQAAALGLAAIATLSILASVNGLAAAPRADSLLAAGAVPVAIATVAASS